MPAVCILRLRIPASVNLVKQADKQKLAAVVMSTLTNAELCCKRRGGSPLKFCPRDSKHYTEKGESNTRLISTAKPEVTMSSFAYFVVFKDQRVPLLTRGKRSRCLFRRDKAFLRNSPLSACPRIFVV